MKGHVIARVGLWTAPEDAYAPYYREALAHFGLLHDLIEFEPHMDLGGFDVVVLAGEGELPTGWSRALRDWVEAGGRLVLSGCTWGFHEWMGLEPERKRLPAADTLRPTPGAEAFWPPEAVGTRFFGGTYALATRAQMLGTTCSGFCAMAQRQIGRGAAYWFAPHVGQTMALMQLGRAVACDGVGPSDGTARLADGILRAEDGLALSFEHDRNAEGWFDRAHADVVKEAWLRLILRAIEGAELRSVLLWHWPRSAEGAATVSVDCGTFEPEYVRALYRSFANHGIGAAWIVATPGYPLDVYRSMRKWEHDVGLLYVPEDRGGAERLRTQYVALNRATALPLLTCTRAVDGGWRGWLEMYEAAEECGSRLSLAKGGRQAGTTGFAFGTSHLFFPRQRDGSALRIAELPYQIFDPGLESPREAIEPLVREASLRHGCAHLVLRVESANDAKVRAGLQTFAVAARERKLTFLSPERVLLFERARRAMRVQAWSEDQAFGLKLISDTAIEGLTVLMGGPPVAIETGGRPWPCRVEPRYGTSFSSFHLDFGPKSQLRVVARASSEQAA